MASKGENKKNWNHHLEKVLDSAALLEDVFPLNLSSKSQGWVTGNGFNQSWQLRLRCDSGCEQCTKSTALLSKPQKPMELSRVSSVYDNDFIPSSYHPKFLIIGLKNGCKTPGMVAFFCSPPGMPGHNSQANPGMPGRSSVVSGAFTGSPTDCMGDFVHDVFWGCFGMPSWFLMPG